MEHYLKAEKLWYVTNTIKPSQNVVEEVVQNQTAITKWEEDDEQCLARVVLCIDDSQVTHVRSAVSAKQAWNMLKQYHERNTLTNKVCIMRRICSTKLSEGGNIEQHLGELTDMFQKLVDLGDELIDSWKVALVLSSLPASYDTLVTALESRPEADLTISMVHEKLVSEYKRRSDSNGGASNSTALKVTSNAESECFFCKRKGHMKKDCRKYKKWKEGKEKEGEKQQKANKVSDDTHSEFLFTISPRSGSMNQWIIDSGATCHVASNKSFFRSLGNACTDLAVANGERIKVEGKGTCMIDVINENGKTITVTARDVLFAPQLEGNLLSVKKLLDGNLTVNFTGDGCEIRKGDLQIAIADETSGLYVLRQPNKAYAVTSAHKSNCIHSLHRAFGHRDPVAIRDMCTKDMVDGIQVADCGIKEKCEVCLKAKQARLPFAKSISKSVGVLDLIHTDVCGPMQTTSMGGKRYILTFIDDFSRYTVIYLLKEKSEVEAKLREYVAMVENKFAKKPIVLRSDRGGEYTGDKVTTFLKSKGIQIQYTAPYTPQQNGVAERKNRTLVEMARCMLEDASLPYVFWAEAVCTANYLQNRLPSRSIETTPFEAWNKRKPALKHCVPFGAKCFVHVPCEKRRKLDNTAIEMIFVGYDENSKAYRCFNTKAHKLVISRDVKFIDVVEISISPATKDKQRNNIDNQNADAEIKETDDDETDDELSEYESFLNDTDVSADDTLVESDAEETVVERRISQRANKGKPPKRLIEEINKVQEIHEPKNFKEATSCEEKAKWMCAMKEEIKSLKSNGTWSLCKLPKDRAAVGCKWVFKLKRNSDGEIVRYKARLVAQGFSQKFGTDYDLVFAPVAKQTTFRTLLTLASKRGMQVRHIDAKTAFLNGHLKETIYMKQPLGFCEGDGLVCLLKKSIYGLKQAAKTWNDAIHAVLMDAGFRQNCADPCLYSRKVNDDWCYLLIYVDDMIVAAKGNEVIDELKNVITRHFDLEDLGEIKFYLGIEVSKSSDGFFQLSQSSYIKKVANDFGLSDAKDSKVPMNVNYGKSSTADDETLLQNNTDYQKLIGCLLYIAVNTRPDIAASVSILAQRVSTPKHEDWNELKRVVKYLKGTSTLKLVLGINKPDENPVVGFADANWAEDKVDRKSNSGYIFIVYGAAVSWACRKQTCVALSSTEAEFIALSEACKEAFWLRQLLIGMNCKIDQPIKMNEDNQSCIKLIKEEKLSNRTKHIDTRYNFVKDYVDKGIVSCSYCPTEIMVADILTKPLPGSKHIELRKKCGLHD